MYLIRINKDGDISPEHDGIYLVPEFKYLLDSARFGKKSFLAVALYCDYESPYRLREEGQDREKAIAAAVYGEKKIPNWKDSAIVAAIEAYKFLQRDSIREHLHALESSLKKMDEFLSAEVKSVKDVTENLKARKEMKTLRQEIYDVRAEVASSISEVKLKGGRIMSWLEQREFRKAEMQKMEKL